MNSTIQTTRYQQLH